MRVDSPQSHYDVIVAGGGLVGASFAALLNSMDSKGSLSILIVEAIAPDTALQPGFDARSTALSWSSREVLQQMDLWASIETELTPINDIHVSDRGHFGSVLIKSSEHDQEALGYVVENQTLSSHLNSLLGGRASLSLLAPATITSVKPKAEGMALEIAAGDASWEVSAALVVLCDGARSPISASLGIDQQRKQYNQHALIANIGFSRPHRNIAYERFLESGPLAILPLSNFEDEPRGALIWTLEATESEEYRLLEEEELLGRLQDSFGHRLGRMTRIGERFVFPLTLSTARERVRPGLVLLGNVAQTLHPVAGQGLNLALRDAAALARTVSEAAEQGQALGAMQALQPYAEERERDQRRAIQLTDQMIHWFSTSRTSRVLARKIGMLCVDLMPTLRRGFARRAMGLS